MQLIQLLLEAFEPLTSLAELAFSRQALVLGEVASGVLDQRVGRGGFGRGSRRRFAACRRRLSTYLARGRRSLDDRRRLSEQLDGISHGPDGSLDKLLMTWVEQSVGHAALAVGGTEDTDLFSAYLYSRAQSVMGGTSEIQKNIIASRILGLGV